MLHRRQKLRVLFVDDDESVRKTWAYCYGDTFDATVVGSAEEALALLESPPKGLQYDVLVADHRMPGMSGAELCWKARAVSPGTARVIISAFRDREVQLCPYSTIVDKPNGNGKLEGVIRNVAGGAGDEDDVRRREREAEHARDSARSDFLKATERLKSWIPDASEKRRA